MMDFENKHIHSEKIINSLKKKFPGVKVYCNGYLPGPNVHVFLMNDFDTYYSKPHRLRTKTLQAKYGKKHSFIIAFKAF